MLCVIKQHAIIRTNDPDLCHHMASLGHNQLTVHAVSNNALYPWPSYYSWWRHQMENFSELLALCVGNSPLTGEFPSQRPAMGALMSSLICAWTNGWVNNRDADDLICHRAHYDINVMHQQNTSEPFNVSWSQPQRTDWSEICNGLAVTSIFFNWTSVSYSLTGHIDVLALKRLKSFNHGNTTVLH